MKTRKILLVYPEIPATYWSFKYALPFIGYKTLMPPLGLLTVAALLPDSWEVRLLDMNIGPLTGEDVASADMVFVSAMIVQKESFEKVVRLCNEYGTPVAAGGPYPTSSHEKISGVDHFILNEGEVTLPQFLRDLEEGSPKRVYLDESKPDITKTPPPRFDLIDINAYESMAIQTSRGCPFNCEFCDIIEMFGRVPRYKLPEQVVREMDILYRMGRRGSLFIVDDNFIGNKAKVKALLDAIIEYQRERDYPFALFTEASINLAQDEDLMDRMVRAGFDTVFVGIETPDEETLAHTQKQQNVRADILGSVRAIQAKGIEVMAGFIIGFDTDPENIFDLQIDFIQKAGIPLAMIGTMVALPNTQLYRRLEREGRILGETDGNNTHSMEINFIPRMPVEKLLEGYRRVIATIYRPDHYFKRCATLLKRMPYKKDGHHSITARQIKALFTSLARQTFSRYGLQYLRLLGSTLISEPRHFPNAVNLAVKGYHFFKMTDDIMHAERLSEYMRASLERLEEEFETRHRSGTGIHPEAVRRLAGRALTNVRRTYKKLTPELKALLREAYHDFRLRCETVAYIWMQKAVSFEDPLQSGG